MFIGLREKRTTLPGENEVSHREDSTPHRGLAAAGNMGSTYVWGFSLQSRNCNSPHMEKRGRGGGGEYQSKIIIIRLL